MKNKKLHHTKKTGFKVPDTYFESLDNDIFNKLNNHHVLNTIKSSGFQIPKDYLETFDETLLTKSTTGKVIALFNKTNLIYISSIAAAVLLLFNLSIFKDIQTFDALDTETIDDYVTNQNIETYEIASLLTEDDLTETNFIDYNLEEETVSTFLLNNIKVEDLFIE